MILYATVALASAGVVLAGFGLAHQLVAPAIDGGAIDSLMAAPVALEASPVLSASGRARLDGEVQRIDVDASAGEFAPDHLRVAAGVPVEVHFSAGAGVASHVVIPDLGVSADLARRGTIVRLSALEPGTYPIVGADGAVTGLLVAE